MTSPQADRTFEIVGWQYQQGARYDGTQLMWHLYPESIREILRRHEWHGNTPHPNLIFVEGDELRTIYRDCTEEEASRAKGDNANAVPAPSND